MARILVVDDEDVVRSLLKTILKHDGHEVVEACDGNEAIGIHKDDPADLVIVDLVMPKKHGLDTILEMREHHPKTRFIVMTGALPSLLDSENMATMLGNALTLAKPMTPPDLLQAVHKALGPAEPAEA
ncbi:MAG: response regulator [Planctomycetota bacterium]|jgi:DNA-binding NtrC family response regulator